MAIAYAQDVRNISDLDEDDITDNKIEILIQIAWEHVMSDAGKRENNEELRQIDNYRKNTVDGSNTVFYTMNSYSRHMGDLDYSQTLDIADVSAYEYKADKTKSALTLSAITDDGKITFTTAPEAGSKIKVTYIHLPLTMTDSLLKRATTYLATALAYGKIEAGDNQSVSFRGLSIMKSPAGYDGFMEKYKSTLNEILTIEDIIGRFDDDRGPRELGVKGRYIDQMVFRDGGGGYY